MSEAQVRHWIASAGALAVLTGAGMSAESGVPTFRDAQTGLWSRFRPEDLATEEASQSLAGHIVSEVLDRMRARVHG